MNLTLMVRADGLVRALLNDNGKQESVALIEDANAANVYGILFEQCEIETVRVRVWQGKERGWQKVEWNR